MIIGFTGTRHGMTQQQKNAFHDAICCEPHGITEFHHGDCIGADDEAADIIYEIMHGEDPGPPIRVVVHPPVDVTFQANNACYDEILPPKTHLARNRDIVRACDLLIAAPYQAEHQPRGGTWYTIDYAKKVGKPVWIIQPDGVVRKE